tara:strand:- start:757 stop:1923 length:1167 start_codon:yes stop_codon:yes gene_type:complete
MINYGNAWMNKVIIICVLFFSICYSQVRYIDEVFDEVSITQDIVYANAPDLPFIFLFEWNTYDIDLDMDIYEPEGDIETLRPVIIFLHPGSFFSGNNELDDMVSLSIDAAKRGYVAISANYRLGLNIISTYSGERAVYRGVQDASALIRYIREYHNELRVDPNRIFLWGSSAGSFISLHLAYSEDNERPGSTYGGGSDPDLGCIDCSGNNYQHNSKPTAIVSCWGAIGDLSWIGENNTVPAIMFHGTSDIVVPYDYGLPFTINIALPVVYGSNQISGKLSSLGIQNEAYIEDGEPHEYWGSLNGNWTSGPNEFYVDILEKTYNFLYQFLDIDTSDIFGDLNQDGTLNVLDVIQVVNFILSNEYVQDADLNEDNNLDVTDIIMYINLIL